jgi:hypothetical protein
MRCSYRPWLLVLLILLFSGAAFAADYAVEAAPDNTFKAVSPELAPALDPHGVTLFSFVTGKKTAICRVWWRSQLPAKLGSDEKGNIAYSGLRTGELVGVVQYLVMTEDFQHHEIKPGVYSMRYAQLDQGGSDEAISPYKDFAVLSPIWADHHGDDLIPMEELEKRSRFVTHDKESAVLSLVPVNPAYKTFPWAISDDKGFCTVQALLSVQSGQKKQQMPLALILVRPPYENEGS